MGKGGFPIKVRFTNRKWRWVAAGTLFLLLLLYVRDFMYEPKDQIRVETGDFSAVVTAMPPLEDGHVEEIPFTGGARYLDEVTLWFVPMNAYRDAEQPILLSITTAEDDEVVFETEATLQYEKNTEVWQHTLSLGTPIENEKNYLLHVTSADSAKARFCLLAHADPPSDPVVDAIFSFYTRDYAQLVVILAAGIMALLSLLFTVAKASAGLRVAAKVLMSLFCLWLLLFMCNLWVPTAGYKMPAPSFAAVVTGYFWVMALVLFAFALVGRIPWALRIAGGCLAVFSITSYFIFDFRGTPFVPMDIFGAGTALDILGSYTLRLARPVVLTVFLFLLIWILASKAALPSFAWNTARKKIYLRCCSVAVGIFLLASTLNRTYFYQNDLAPDFWYPLNTVQKNGAVQNFIGNFPFLKPSSPKGYSSQRAKEISRGYPSKSLADAGEKPDIILVLGESWADITGGGVASTNQPVTPFLDSLQDADNAVSGQLVVPVFGGGTSLPEFEVLTGTSTVFGLSLAPYSLHVSSPLPSLGTSLRDLGYKTAAIHTGWKDSWNRNGAYPMLGVDSFLDQSDFESEFEFSRFYLSDQMLYDETLTMMDEMQGPRFVACITLQTHGGYDDERYESGITLEDSPGTYPLAEQYLGALHGADQAFESFLAELEKSGRPTVVLAYGDHFPAVENELLDEVFGDDPLGRYTTPFYLWANYDLAPGLANGSPTISTNYLSSYLLQAAGLPLTGYQQFLLGKAQDYPVVSPHGVLDSEGNYYLYDEAATFPDIYEEAVLHYNLVFDKRHYPPDFYTLSP